MRNGCRGTGRIPVCQISSSRNNNARSVVYGRRRKTPTTTYNELALPGEVAVADADEGVVILAFAERCGVDVRPEEADGGQDALVKGSLWRVCSYFNVEAQRSCVL